MGYGPTLTPDHLLRYTKDPLSNGVLPAMARYSTILVALDLTDDSGTVLDSARRLSESGSAMHLVHVTEHPVTALGSATGKNHRQGELQVRQAVYPRLQAFAEELGLMPERIHILFGDAPEEVTHLAHKLGADVIVVGSHGETGLRRLLGSTATHILHQAHCDVLTVRIEKK